MTLAGTKITYEQISKTSGISLSTISRVLNKSPYVSARTREKVIAAIHEMGIDTSTLDLAPVPADKLIIFNVPTLKNPFYSPIATSARIAAGSHGYSLLINEDPITDDTIDSFIQLIKNTRAVGLILSNSLSYGRLKRLSALLPVVTCCEADTLSTIPFVTIDDEGAAINATRHLINLGRKRIGFINGPGSFKYARDRYNGYSYALKKAGITIDRTIIADMNADMDYDMAKAACIRMLNYQNPPDAFFCISDVLAAAAINAAQGLGYRVPEDVAVVGFDDIQISSIMNPSITTVRQPTTQIGSIATEMVIRLVEKDEYMVKSLYLGTELIIRESTTLGRRE